MEFIKNNKLFLFLAVPMLCLFIWAQSGGFKLLKPEGGNKWSPKGSSGSVHHK